MAKELDWRRLVDEIEISESAGITVEQIDDEITIAIASVVCVHFQVTADQALKLSRALAVAARLNSLRQRTPDNMAASFWRPADAAL